MMTVALAFEKKHQRRVLPTRMLSASAPAPNPDEGGALEQLHSACRNVVSEVGPSPYLYAQKHQQEALAVMAEVERVLWPDTTNVPASFERMDAATLRAVLFRTFRHEVAAETFAAAWASNGAAALVDAIGALDDFEVALAWGTKSIIHIDVEPRMKSALIGGRFTMFATPAGTAELPLARAIRPYVVGAPADAYALAVERARALHAKNGVSLFVRAALAFTLPDETDLAAPVIEALLGSEPTGPLEVMARSEWLRWMLASPLAPALALRILDALDGQVESASGRDETPIHTWLALANASGTLVALHDALVERTRARMGGRAWSAARNLATGLAALQSDAVLRLFVEFVGHKALVKLAPEYIERFADRAYPELVRTAVGKGKHAKRAAELATVLAQKRPDLANGAKQSESRPAGQQPPAVVKVAKVGELPPCLATPPRGSKPAKRPAPAAGVAAPPYDEHVDFEHGELEAWTAEARTMPWFRNGKDERAPTPGLSPGMIAYGLRSERMRRIELAVRGVDAIDDLVQYANVSPERGLTPLSRVGSPRLALPAARAMFGQSEAVRADAQLVLARHPRAAAIGLVHAAAAGDDDGRAGLRFLVLAGFGAVVREVVTASGVEASRALADVVSLDAEQAMPLPTSKLPAFFVPHGLPAPILAASEHALPPEAIARLGVLLRSSEVLFPHPAIAHVRSACTPASLDAFVWALERQWEHARAPDAQRFALLAVGWLGSEAILGRLADEVEASERKGKGALAGGMLSAFAASPLPLGAALLARFAARGRHDEVRGAAETWLDLVSTLRGTTARDVSLHFASGQAGATAASEVRRAVEVRLDLAMTFGERFAMPLFVERVLEHPHAREVAVGLIYVLRDASGRIASLATPAPGAGLVRWVDRAGREIDCAAVTHVEVAHPLAMDAAGAGLRDAFRSVLAAAGRRQAIPQLDRPTFSALDGWPVVRGTVVSYRKLERLVDRRGWRLYRTHCGSALHDWSYLQRTVDVGRVRISLGFNFGEHVGDSTLGELIGQDEDGTPGVRHAMRPSPEGLSAIAMSELQLDLATLRG